MSRMREIRTSGSKRVAPGQLGASTRLYNVIISSELRRDRLFFIGAIADLLLTILGAASEALGLDKLLKANTVKRRVHSLYRQGLMWYELIPNMPQDRLKILMEKFSELLMQKRIIKDILSFA